MDSLTILDIILELRKQIGKGGLNEGRITNPVVERRMSRLEQAEGTRPEPKPLFLGCDASSRRNGCILIVGPRRLDESLEDSGHGPAEGLEMLLRQLHCGFGRARWVRQT